VRVFDGGTSQNLALSISGTGASALRWNPAVQNGFYAGLNLVRGSIPATGIVDTTPRDGLADSYGAPINVVVSGTTRSSCGLAAATTQVVEADATPPAARTAYFYLLGHRKLGTSTTLLGFTSGTETTRKTRTTTACP